MNFTAPSQPQTAVSYADRWVCGDRGQSRTIEGNRRRWRRRRDSNPRYPCEYAAFRVRCFQPLSHFSAAWSAIRRAALDNGGACRLQGPFCVEMGLVAKGSRHRPRACLLDPPLALTSRPSSSRDDAHSGVGVSRAVMFLNPQTDKKTAGSLFYSEP